MRNMTPSLTTEVTFLLLCVLTLFSFQHYSSVSCDSTGNDISPRRKVKVSDIQSTEIMNQIKNGKPKMAPIRDTFRHFSSKNSNAMNNINKVNKIESRIIGGADAKKDEFPFIASIFWAKVNDDFMFEVYKVCGASLIDSRFVLTAAHCMPSDDSQVIVGMGRYDFSDESEMGEYHIVEEKFVHDSFTNPFDSLWGDIALLRLQTPSERTPVRLIDHTLSSKINTDLSGKVIGWGMTAELSAPADVLQEIDLPLVTNDQCEASFLDQHYDQFHENAEGFAITSDMICAGYGESGRAPCQGDSGGPLMTFINDEPYLTGLVSFGSSGCGSYDTYGVFTRLSAYSSWIESRKVTTMTPMSSNSFLGNLIFAKVGNKEKYEYTMKNLAHKSLDFSVYLGYLKEISSSYSPCKMDIEGQCKFDLFVYSEKPTIIKSSMKLIEGSGTEIERKFTAVVMDNTNLIDFTGEEDKKMWISGGNGKWMYDVENEVERKSQAKETSDVVIKSPPIGDQELSCISRNFWNKARIQFDWKIDSEVDYDLLSVYLDGKLKKQISGADLDWKADSVTTWEEGRHTVTWCFIKDAAVSVGTDQAWLKNFSIERDFSHTWEEKETEPVSGTEEINSKEEVKEEEVTTENNNDKKLRG